MCERCRQGCCFPSCDCTYDKDAPFHGCKGSQAFVAGQLRRDPEFRDELARLLSGPSDQEGGPDAG